VPDDGPLPLGAKLALAAEIVVAYVQARRTLRRSGLRSTLADLRARAGAPAGTDGVAVGRRLGRAVVRTLRLVPADTRCLMRSLVLTRLLTRRGIASQLVIAVRPGEGFAAHAWVEHDGVELLPGRTPSFEKLVVL
jgi:hypothetical protein